MQALSVPTCPITAILHQHEIQCKTPLIRDSWAVWSPLGHYEQPETKFMDDTGAHHVISRQTVFRHVSRTQMIQLWQVKISNLYPYKNPMSIVQRDYKMENSFVTIFSSLITGNQFFPNIIVFEEMVFEGKSRHDLWCHRYCDAVE
jgi:hypothetical protein